MRKILRNKTGGTELEVVGDLLIGRIDEADLTLNEKHVSRRHAMLKLEGDNATLEDLGSSNGTYVNDKRIAGAVILRAGDVIRFDTEEYVYEVPDLETADDGQKTMLRPMDEPVAVEGSEVRKQPAWVDPNKHVAGGPKTEFFDVAKVKELSAESAPVSKSSAASVAEPSLEILSGAKQGQVLTLKSSGAQGEWTIGCDADRDIVLEDKGVSGVHAKLVRDGKRFKLSDQMSTSGTFVNGKRSNVSYLADGDRIRLGPVECIFHTPESGGVTRADTAAKGKSSTARNLVLAVLGFIVTLAVIYFLFLR